MQKLILAEINFAKFTKNDSSSTQSLQLILKNLKEYQKLLISNEKTEFTGRNQFDF